MDIDRIDNILFLYFYSLIAFVLGLEVTGLIIMQKLMQFISFFGCLFAVVLGNDGVVGFFVGGEQVDGDGLGAIGFQHCYYCWKLVYTHHFFISFLAPL